MMSIDDLERIVHESSSVEQAFGKYMSLLDAELWSFAALQTVFGEEAGG